MISSALSSLSYVAGYQLQPTGLSAQPAPDSDTEAVKVTLSSGVRDPDYTYQRLLNQANAAANRQYEADAGNTATDETQGQIDSDRLEQMLQQVLDNKTGLDRKKLEELQQKIDALMAKEGELTDAEQQQLELLQQQKEAVIKEAAAKLAGEQN
ncbi:hypothetical protein [Rheinheimera sp.]|uniref:hypothetical protein n=1 Tax=Rheinheimera sp. TaxID=1869214 RepID=UPI00307D5F0A